MIIYFILISWFYLDNKQALASERLKTLYLILMKEIPLVSHKHNVICNSVFSILKITIVTICTSIKSYKLIKTFLKINSQYFPLQ